MAILYASIISYRKLAKVALHLSMHCASRLTAVVIMTLNVAMTIITAIILSHQ